jgi:hypothetical protein
MIQDHKFELKTGEYTSTKNIIRNERSSSNQPARFLESLNNPALPDLPDNSIVVMHSSHSVQEKNAYRDSLTVLAALVRTFAERILMSFYMNVMPLQATSNA